MTSIAFDPFDPQQFQTLNRQTQHGWNQGVRRNADGSITEIGPWDSSTGTRVPDRTYHPRDFPRAASQQPGATGVGGNQQAGPQAMPRPATTGGRGQPPMTPPSTSPRPQSQSMPPRPGQSQRGPAGQAQSQQPQPQGTPYNPQQGMNFSAYQPQQPARQARGEVPGLRMAPGMEAAVFGGERQYNPQGAGGNFSAWDPNIANNAQATRPPPFQASYGQLGGGFSGQPDTQQRDAFISQINNQLGQMQGQSWQRQMGAPQFDFARMFGQAGNMVQQGYQNPFSQPQRQGPPPGMAGDLMYGPGDPQYRGPPAPPPPGMYY